MFPRKVYGEKRPKKPEMQENNDGQPQPKKKKVREFNFSLHPKRKIAIEFLYFGWEYDGLVQQANTDQTVEKHLMDALYKTKLITDWKESDVSRCGRTDKGVSAFKQVAALVVRSSDPGGDFAFWDEGTDPNVIANYKSNGELTYLRMLNGVLPKSIRATAWAPVPRDFSARHGCNLRIYKYNMPRANLNIEAMQKACDSLVGEHDFRNFCQIDANEARVTACHVRRIFEATVKPISRNDGCYDLIELTVKGSGFLWHMIRYIVTILHEIGQGNESPELVSTMLDVSKTPCRPQYGLGADTPLCLFDCRFDSSNLKWQRDESANAKTIELLQSTWADFTTKAQMLKNMISDLSETSGVDTNKGLLEFTLDRKIPATYIPFAERPVCDSLEAKLEKLKKKQAENGKVEK